MEYMDRWETACSMWFQRVEHIGSKTLFALKARFGTMGQAYMEKEEVWQTCLNERQYHALKEWAAHTEPMEYLRDIEQQGIRYISFFDAVFPQRLKRIPDPPFGLFVKGSLPEEARPAVAVIGARACSLYGEEAAKLFTAGLARYGVQIISGMARGIDAIGQEACLRAGGRTFAVLGNGVDICYPPELGRLYGDIEKQGGLISSYPPGMQPLAGNFPPRNRIISGLSDFVLVVEAKKKSGTLITVDMALEQGKEVGVVPGRITDRMSEGCHGLIKQGANVVTDVEQLVEMLGQICDKQLYPEEISKERYKIQPDRINIKSRQNISGHMQSIMEILLESRGEALETEQIYKRWLQKGYKGTFQSMLEALMDLELMDLCKCYKNRFSIR